MSRRWRVALPATTIDVPAAAAFDALRKGALFSIARVYWDCGCDDKALPETDDGWQAIASASTQGWRRIRERVLIAFEQAKPNIKNAHKAVKAFQDNGRVAVAHARQCRMAKIQERKEKPSFSDNPNRSVPFLPVKSEPYSFGHHGHANNGQQIPYRAARGLEGGLVDKPKKT